MQVPMSGKWHERHLKHVLCFLLKLESNSYLACSKEGTNIGKRDICFFLKVWQHWIRAKLTYVLVLRLLGFQKVLEEVCGWTNECDDFFLVVQDRRICVQWGNGQKLNISERWHFPHSLSLRASASLSISVCVLLHVNTVQYSKDTSQYCKDNSSGSLDSLNIIPMKSCLASCSIPDCKLPLSASALSLLASSASPPQHINPCLMHVSSFRLQAEAKLLLSLSSMDAIVPPLILHWTLTALHCFETLTYTSCLLRH